MNQNSYCYIMASKKDGVLYVGSTTDLIRRIFEHKNNLLSNSFTSKYWVHTLVYYEEFHLYMEAVAREYQLKGGSRAKKIKLIEAHNPTWKDLSEELESH